jgi:hypothetical protein
MQRIAIALAAWAFVSGQALSQSPDQASSQPSISLGNEIIARANAAGIFVSETNPPGAAVRHVRSGMRCVFGVAGDGEITIYPNHDGLERGDDVSCGENTSMGTVTLFAERATRPQSNEDALTAVVGAMRAVHQQMQEIPLSALTTLTLGNESAVPPYASAAFVVRDGDRSAITRASTYVANGWVYTLRFTTNSSRSNIMADIMWKTMLVDLQQHPAPMPATP